MNKEKTKVIWIGRKKFSKEKLPVSINLEWGNTNFNFLGIEFSMNSSTIVDINYKKTLEKIKILVNKWKKRTLTPFGRITVIKTHLLSQCVHLLATLPRSDSFLKELNYCLYQFLWNGKHDKIRRTTTNLKGNQGGMNMTNKYNFEKALKVAWVKRIFTQPTAQWCNLLEVTYKNISKILLFGDNWCPKTISKIYTCNSFWKDALKDWKLLVQIQLKTNNTQPRRHCIWYNSQFSDKQLFYPDWYKSITDRNGIVLSREALNKL